MALKWTNKAQGALNSSADRKLRISSPTKAIVSLKNDRGTSYNAYMEVYNELRAAYNEIWDEQAQIRYGKNYDDCTKAEQKGIRDDFPLVISEAESTSFGEES